MSDFSKLATQYSTDPDGTHMREESVSEHYGRLFYLIQGRSRDDTPLLIHLICLSISFIFRLDLALARTGRIF